MLLTEAQQIDSTQLLPEMAKALARIPPPPLPAPSNRIEALRGASAAYDKKLLDMLGQSPSNLSEFCYTIPMRDGYQSTAKICMPATKPPGPLIVLFFSGAFITGTPDQLSQIARALATSYSATVVSAGYRLAPENPFPLAAYDAIDSVLWAAANATLLSHEHGKVLRALPRKKGFIVGGASSGRNLAAVVRRYLQKNAFLLPVGVKITGQWIGCAQLFPDDAATSEVLPERLRSYFTSRKQNADAPVLNATARAAGGIALQCYDPSSELRFPSLGGLVHQPKKDIQSCGMDPLRDDGILYDELLQEAGVHTKGDFYKGVRTHSGLCWVSVRALDRKR